MNLKISIRGIAFCNFFFTQGRRRPKEEEKTHQEESRRRFWVDGTHTPRPRRVYRDVVNKGVDVGVCFFVGQKKTSLRDESTIDVTGGEARLKTSVCWKQPRK